MKCSNLVLDSIDGMHYKCNKISLNHGRLYIDSPDWIKKKTAAIKPKNDDDTCFQYAVTAVLSHENIVKDHKDFQKLSLL